MTAYQKLKPSILSIGKVPYSVSVLGIWGATETANVYHLWHVIVRASNPIDAAEVACTRVKDYITETGGIDGLTSLEACAIIPGRHPNLMDDIQQIPGEDNGLDDGYVGEG